ncbi:hypothetical protein QYF61_015703, partial [Mycteria americana]
MKPLFEKARRQRGVTVPCHLVVLTGRGSQDSVKEPATKLREDQISIYAIDVWEANICTTEVCKEVKGDVMFLVDNSASIGTENFLKTKNFMRELVNRTDVGADRVQIGVVQFSHKPKEEFKLNTYSTKRDILSVIDRISPLQSTTPTGEALKFVLKYFQAKSGSHHAVKKVLILTTDGELQDEVKALATVLRGKGIIIYSAGVFNTNKTQLEEIIACFDPISSQREGHHLYHAQAKLEKHFPGILQALLSLRDVSCNVGSKAESSVAVQVKNTVTPISTKFYTDSESVLHNLSDAVIKRPSQLNVLLVFSDGVDDDLEALQQKSEELKNKGSKPGDPVVLKATWDILEMKENRAQEDYLDHKEDKATWGVQAKEGDNGEDGSDGIRGEEGSPGVPGKKGEKGDIGYL